MAALALVETEPVYIIQYEGEGKFSVKVQNTSLETVRFPCYYCAPDLAWSVCDCSGKKIQFIGPRKKRREANPSNTQDWLVVLPGEITTIEKSLSLLNAFDWSAGIAPYTVTFRNESCCTIDSLSRVDAYSACSKKELGHGVYKFSQLGGQVKYRGRPEATTSCVDPSLFSFGHTIIEADFEQSRGILYLGPQECAGESMLEKLKNKNIQAIVNCTKHFACHHEKTGDIAYCVVGVNDEMHASIDMYFDGASAFIEASLAAGKNVLVHCRQGISRSSTIVIAYLMQYYHMTRDEAYLFAKNKRPAVNPNLGFWTQLGTYESKLKSKVDQAGESRKSNGLPIDEHWPKVSSVNFQMLRSVQSYHFFFPELHGISSPHQVLALALDHVFGNGFFEPDIQWLIQVLNALPRELDAHNYALTQFLTKKVVGTNEMVDDHFLDTWTGDYNPRKLDHIKTLIVQARDASS